MLEKEIEHQLVMETGWRGGKAVKFVSPSYSGMPDRLVLLPDGKMAFVEVKAPGKKPRLLQKKRHAMLRRMGYQVFILDAKEEVSQILDEITHASEEKEGENHEV